jgi:hypothetical protein
MGHPINPAPPLCVSAQFAMQPVRDGRRFASTIWGFEVYRKGLNSGFCERGAFCCTIHGEIHNLIEVLHLRAQIEQA